MLKFLFLILISSSWLSALQWPVDGPDLVSSFGAQKEKSFDVGVVLKGANDRVEPYQEGELIFIAPEGYGVGDESGVIVLQHDGGFRSCYGGIITGSNIENRSYLKEDDQLGRWTDGLRFSIRDSQLNSWVNPLSMFTSLEDDQAPKVEGVFIRSDEGVYELSEASKVPSGTYNLLLRVSDKLTKEGLVLMPDQIKVRYLGRVLFSLSFGTIFSQEGELHFEGSDKASSLFLQGGVIDAGPISVSQGTGFLEVEVTDYRGNRSVKKITINKELR